MWSDSWPEIWLPLVDDEEVPEDIFCELYRDLAQALSPPLKAGELADIIGSPQHSRVALVVLSANDFTSERAVVSSLESVHATLYEFDGDELPNRYFNLLSSFIEKFNLRYDLRDPCNLYPTLPGVFASLMRDLRAIAKRDAHLDTLMNDLDSALSDLRYDTSDSRIRICIQRQINLLEALGAACPGVTARELGGICDQVTTWPHRAIKSSLKNLYGFASDYPGIRHGGNRESALRTIEMRDMVAISVLLAGFAPYLSKELNADLINLSDGHE